MYTKSEHYPLLKGKNKSTTCSTIATWCGIVVTLILLTLSYLAFFSYPFLYFPTADRVATTERVVAISENVTASSSTAASFIEKYNIFYGVCDWASEKTTRRDCSVHRVQEDLSVGSRQDDRCRVTLSSESGGVIETRFINVQALGEHRAIVRWFETRNQTTSAENRTMDDDDDGDDDEKYRLRFSVVNFTDCRVRTTTLVSRDHDERFGYRHYWKENSWLSRSEIDISDDRLRYLKDEDNFEFLLS